MALLVIGDFRVSHRASNKETAVTYPIIRFSGFHMKSSIMIEHHNIRSTQQFHPTLGILISFFIIIFAFISTSMIPSVHADISLDGSMGSSGALVGPDYTVGHDLGRLQGTNLFHSFSRFNVMTGESATFTGPNAIENVIGRVTGGTSSSIDGLLRSTIQDANLFLINPSGVMFGPNATLDVNGSFHVSTADYIGLSDGGVFYADPALNSVLTVAPPSAFGFLGESPAAITIDGSSLRVPGGETLSVVGGDIEIVSGALNAPGRRIGTLSIPGGRINLASVASGGEVIFNGQNQEESLNVDTFESLGKIDITQGGELGVSGPISGNIFIRGDSLALDRSVIHSHSWADAGDTDIHVEGDLILTNMSGINSSWNWSGSGGNILLEVGRLIISDGSTIINDAMSDSNSGRAGNITIRATEQVYLSSGSGDDYRQSYISSSTYGIGHGGTISISTPSLMIEDHAGIFAVAYMGFDFFGNVVGGGNAGDILIDVGNLSIRNAGIGNPTGFLTTGDVGHITIRATGSVILADNSVILSSTDGSGEAGTISISTPILTIDSSEIDANTGTYAEGAGGDILVETESLTLTNAAKISSSTFGAGHGGNVTVKAEDVLISGRNSEGLRSAIFSSTVGTGEGGNIDLQAGQIQLKSGALISAASTGSGNAGTIDIAFKDTFLLNEGYVVTGANQADGGNIRIHPGRTLYLVDGAISAEVGGGPETIGGNIYIELDNVALNGSEIVANAYEGKGGNIQIVADTFLSDPSSEISASSELGIEGTVEINAPDVNITGIQAPLPKAVFSAADLLQNPCIARLKAGDASSFVISGRDGLPIQPGQLLPSPAFLGEVAEK